jgi:prepilin-type N-terminal cleavage/methylation domain-containing protein
VKTKGFTLIELLVTITIIGILAGIAVVSFGNARKKAEEAKKLQDMTRIQTALEAYKVKYGAYPNSDRDGCGTWDVGNQDYDFIPALKNSGILNFVPRHSKATGNCAGYFYYRYLAGADGCDSSLGAFYVLGWRDTNLPPGSNHPSSPGWKCSRRDWSNSFYWVTGSYEDVDIFE